MRDEYLDYIRKIAPIIYKYGMPSYGRSGPYTFKYVGGEIKVTKGQASVDLFVSHQMNIFDFL